MNDYTVKQYGTDSSGRPIWLTAFMHDWIEARCEAVGFRPVIVQGAFQQRNGGGARDSQGFHDKGGCVDFRTTDLTRSQLDRWIIECRDHGGAIWRRDKTPKHGGMDPHAHLTLGDDFPLSDGARISWHSYVTGGDGLGAGPGRDGDAPDYEYRPNPLVLTPPEEDMALSNEDVDRIAKAVAKLVWAEKFPEPFPGESKPRSVKNAIGSTYVATKPK